MARYCLHNGFFLNIEIKPTPDTERATGEIVAAYASHLWASASVPPLLTSFKIEALEGAAEAAPHLPRGLLADTLFRGWLEKAVELGCVAVVLNHALWDADTVAKAQAAGLRTLSYTVNDEWAAQRLIELGTDGIITDRWTCSARRAEAKPAGPPRASGLQLTDIKKTRFPQRRQAPCKNHWLVATASTSRP